MTLNIALTTLFLLMALMVTVIFFCGVENAPSKVREVAESARYIGLKDKVKMVRFW